MAHSSKLVGAFVKAIFVIVLSVRPTMWLAAMRIRAACDHVLHVNSTLVDRVDLATPLSLSSQRLPAPRLLLPRSGLERSDFVLWPQAAVERCLLFRRCAGTSGHLGYGTKMTQMTQVGHYPSGSLAKRMPSMTRLHPARY